MCDFPERTCRKRHVFAFSKVLWGNTFRCEGGFRRRQKVAWGDSGPPAVLLVFGRMDLSKRTACLSIDVTVKCIAFIYCYNMVLMFKCVKMILMANCPEFPRDRNDWEFE